MGMIPPDMASEGAEFEIEILGKRHRATLTHESPYDSANARLRA